MLIRKAEEKDIPRIATLLEQVLEIHAQIRPDIFISGTRKYSDEELIKIIENPATPIFVADVDGEVRGYCFCEIQERSGIANMKDMKTLYIDDLCVDESARGKKIGKQLYEYVLAYAKEIGCHNVTLHVWEGNDSARAFYDNMGFKPQKTLMEKVL